MSVNEFLSQIQTEFKNYRNKLNNPRVIEPNSHSDSYFIEDTYNYEPISSYEPVEGYYTEQAVDNGPVKEYVFKCACNNVSEVSDVQPVGMVGNIAGTVAGTVIGDAITNPTVIVEPGDSAVSPTSLVVDNGVSNESPMSMDVKPKITEKEKAFFG